MSQIECMTDSNTVLNAIRDGITKGAPRNWKVTTLGECFKWGSGGTPSRTEPTYFNGDIPWVVIGDLTDGVVTDTQLKITESGLANSSAKLVEPGSVLVAMYGSIGKLGIAGCRLATNQAIAFTNPHPINAKYLYYYLQWQRPALARLGKGATQLNISQTVLKEFPFLLAPGQEQKIVVAEIEKQFSRLDEAVANLQRVKANLKRYKASVLKDAVEGRLVPSEAELARRDGRSFETGEQLLQLILETRKREWASRGKYEEPPAVETGGLTNLPNGWVWASAEQLSTFITKGTTPAAEKLLDAGIGDVQFLKVYNLTFDGALNHAYKPAFVSRATHEGELLRSQVLAGDVLINIVGPPLGQVSVVPPTIAEANMNQAVARFRPIKPLSTKFVAHALMTESIMAWAIRKAKTTAGQTNLTLDLCRRLPIPLPPLAEQERIVAEVDRRLSLIRGVQAEVDANLKRAQALRQSVLCKSFSG